MCGVCGSLFDRKITLKAHLDIHVREEKKARSKQQKHVTGSSMKVGGVYMPGDIVGEDSDENITEKEVPPMMDTTVNQSHEHQPVTQVAAQEVVTNNYEDGHVEEKLNHTLQNLENVANEPEGDDTSSYIYACNICGEQYTVKADCEAHLAVHTQPVIAEPQPERPELDHQQPLHIVSSPREVPTTVGNNPSPEKHLFNKAKFSAYIYACNVCGKQYTNKSNCKRHMRIHTDEEKNFECDTCHKRFAQKYEVKMHSRIHTGMVPYD